MTLRRPEPTVVADANVLHSNDQRNVLMTLATERLIDLRWTTRIEDEWVGSLQRRMAAKQGMAGHDREASLAHFAEIARKMRVACPRYDIPDHEAFLPKVPRTDIKDQHVAAAAAACSPSTLITWNLDYFDGAELNGLGVILSDPDSLLCRLYDEKPELVVAAVGKAHGFVVRGHVRRGQTPPSLLDYIVVLETHGHPNSLAVFGELLRSNVSEATPRAGPLAGIIDLTVEEQDERDPPTPK